MKVKIGNVTWEPGHTGELKALKDKMARCLEEQAAAKHYRIDPTLRAEAEKWLGESRFPVHHLEDTHDDAIVILQDELGFPFELLALDRVFLGEKYLIHRQTQVPHQPNRDFKICYRFEADDRACDYYQHIENNFPLPLLEPAREQVTANVFHVTGHFEAPEKEHIVNSVNPQNVLFFFNSCRTYPYHTHAAAGQLGHYVLSYFDIPLDSPEKVEDFPYDFYRLLLEGETISAAFLEARRRHIARTQRLSPLLFTLFTCAPLAPVFHSPYAPHHREIDKRITRIEADCRNLTDDTKYPPFLFQSRGSPQPRGSREKNLRSIINSTDDHIWIHGPRAGIGKTTLLYQVFRLFRYAGFNGPVFISLEDDPRLPEIPQDAPGEYFCMHFNLHPETIEPGKSRKHLILVDAVEAGTDIYRHFRSFLEELTNIFGPCRVIAASRHRCPVEGFRELSMEITPGDTNARRLRACYGIDKNIRLPEIPLIYRLYRQAGRGWKNLRRITKSKIFAGFIRRYQEKTTHGRPYDLTPETFRRYLSLLAHCRFQTGRVTRRRFIQRLQDFREENNRDIDWWLFDHERKHYRDAESVCNLLLNTHIIAEEEDFLVFVHHSFYEYLLAYYFAWLGLEEENEDTVTPLMYTEVPDYMRELAGSGVYAGNHSPAYLRLVFDRLFYIRDYKSIETILTEGENQALIKSSSGLWYCLVKGCYFTRNPARHIDEVRAFRFVRRFTSPASLLDAIEPGGTRSRSLLETCYALLNMLFDNNLLEEFFRLALFLENKCPGMEVYGLLSRGFLKINRTGKAGDYLILKEQAIQRHPEKEKHRVRLQAEKGLLCYFKYLETPTGDHFQRGIEALKQAEAYYRRDKREEWNYLFTLRELLRFYRAANQPEPFAEVMRKIDAVGINDHPKTDYIPYLLGREKSETGGDADAAQACFMEGAKGFYGKQLLFESAVVYLWACYHAGSEDEKSARLEDARRVLEEAEAKREGIKECWSPFDAHLKQSRPTAPPEFENPFSRLREFLEGFHAHDDPGPLGNLLNRTHMVA